MNLSLSAGVGAWVCSGDLKKDRCPGVGVPGDQLPDTGADIGTHRNSDPLEGLEVLPAEPSLQPQSMIKKKTPQKIIYCINSRRSLFYIDPYGLTN